MRENKKQVNLGKTLLLGDSYSTYLGYIPEGFDYWYGDSVNLENGVTSVDKTWWHELFSRIDGDIVLNSSWSGTTVCHTGWGGLDCSHKSFIARLDKLIDGGFFEKNKIDTVLVFGGTNDSWSDAPLGEITFADFSRDNLFKFQPAICYLAFRLKTVLPRGRVIFIVNARLKPQIALATEAAAKQYGMEVLLLSEMDVYNNHPTARGMREIADNVLTYLLK